MGTRTRAGQIQRLLDIESDLTPLQKKLETIANQIGLLGLYVAIFTFIALVIRLGVEIFIFHSRAPL